METYLKAVLETQNTFVFFGDRKYLLDKTLEYFKGTNSELVLYNESYFKIEHSLAVRKILSVKPSTKRVVILSFFNINVEAQNALLKTLEEEHHNTSIILITYNKNDLLDTIMSRSVLYVDSTKIVYFEKEVKTLLSTTPTKRLGLAIVKKFLDAKETKEGFDREHLYIFLCECIIFSENKNSISKSILEALSLIVLPGSSKKQLTEYILLSL